MRKALLPVLVAMVLVSGSTRHASAAAVADKTTNADAFRVLDIGERTYDNGPAIAVLLSEPLDPKIRHDEHLRISDTRQRLKSVWILSDDERTLYFTNVAPETRYSVTVMESLRSAAGNVLGKRETRTVETRAVSPVVSFASEGFLLPSDVAAGLPVVSVNVDSINIEFFRLNRRGLVEFVRWRNTTGKRDYYELSRAGEYGELVYSGRFDLDVPENRRKVSHIPVTTIEALKTPGVYLAVMREPGRYEYDYQVTHFLVTDMGLHVRAYDSEALILAASLKTGKALADVSLSFLNDKSEIVAKGTTDVDGRFRYSGKLPGPVHVILAEKAGQIGILPLRVPALDLSEFDLGKRPYRSREVFIYGPRNLYRPGETVLFSALLRDDDGRSVDAPPLTARLYRPDGKEIRRFTWRPLASEKAGRHYFETAVELPPDARTGRWELKVWDAPSASKPCGEYPFQVEEFLPERMKLDLKARDPFAGPETTLHVAVDGRYLYGAPAAGNKVVGRVQVTPKRDLFDPLKGFLFGDLVDEGYRDAWELSEQSLDDAGEAVFEVKSRWSGIASPLSVRVTVDLFETGGRPVTRSVRQTVWPAEALVGIRPLFKENTAEAGPVPFEVIRVTTDGVPAPIDGLVVELVKEDRDYYWEYSESTGWQYKYTEKNYQFLTEALDLDSDKPTPYTLHLEKGQYLLNLKDPATNLITSVRFRVGSGWYHTDTAAASRPDKVVLALDRPAYRPGDVIRLTVTPPHDGEALVAVEGERPLWMKHLPVSAAGTELEIPILAGWDSHNLYISAVVFRPVDAAEKITPNRAMGLIYLPLDRSDRKLALSVVSPEKVVPKGPVSVTIKATAEQPIPENSVFVTLAAVDAGILSITDFKTPDPFEYFFERRRYEANCYDVYGKVIETTDAIPARVRYGGDADIAGGKRPENRVKLVSLFASPKPLNADGEVVFSLDLPDFNGRLRLMALAYDADRFGSAEKEMTVAAPVVTQMAMPRFLAPGDKTELTLDVHNLSDGEKSLNLELSATGPVAVAEGMRTITLSQGRKTTLRFPAEARSNFGAAVVRLKLTGPDVALDREWTLPVRPGYPAVTRKAFKVLKADKTFMPDAAMTADLMSETADAALVVSTRPPINVRDHMKGLIAFPYGCLEQTTSRAYPLLFATPENIDRFGLASLTDEDRLHRLSTAIDRLAGMQLGSGGFGLWDKASPESPWLTVYVTDFLLTAREMGVDVPATMLDQALVRLENYLGREPPDEEYMDNKYRSAFQLAVQSYAGFVLSRLQRAPLGALRLLFDNQKDNAASCLPLAHLGIALRKMGDNNRSRQALAVAVRKRPEDRGYWGDYGSPVRDVALVTALLVDHGAEGTEGFDSLIEDLQKSVHSRRWFSTQERYALFRAGMALNRHEGGVWKGRLSVGGQERIIEHEGAFHIDLTGSDLAGGVVFVSESDLSLYASVTVMGYTRTPPEKDAATIELERGFFDLDGEPVAKTEFKVGELLVVRLKAAAKEYIPDALVVDFLPAGFEAENPNLKHGVKIDDMTIDGRPVWEQREKTDLVYDEYRDDRYVASLRLNDYEVAHLYYLVRVVSPGTFVVPPAFAESMYRPELRGVGSATAPIRVLNESP